MYGGGLGGIYGGGLYGMYGGGLGGIYGGGLYGMYGGGLGGIYGLTSPFGIQNMFYSINTGTGVDYQIPFMQIAPLLGMTSLYNDLFPGLFTIPTE